MQYTTIYNADIPPFIMGITFFAIFSQVKPGVEITQLINQLIKIIYFFSILKNCISYREKNWIND